MDCGFQVLDSSLFQWNLDSGFQYLVGFRDFCAVFRTPNYRISEFHMQNFPGFRIPESLTLGEMTATVGKAKIATGAVTKKTHLRTCINPFCTPLRRH